jgi:hypothetical protein
LAMRVGVSFPSYLSIIGFPYKLEVWVQLEDPSGDPKLVLNPASRVKGLGDSGSGRASLPVPC